MTEELTSSDILQLKLDACKAAIERKYWKYYHLESVQNFIIHLKSFSSEKTSFRMAEKINVYLHIVEDKMKTSQDVHLLAKELYASIWTISDTYRYELGFTAKPSYILNGIFWIALFFIIKEGFGTWAAFGIVSAISLFQIIRAQLKIRARKYF